MTALSKIAHEKSPVELPTSVTVIGPEPSSPPGSGPPRPTEVFCLDRLQRDLGLSHLPRFFGTATACLLSPHSQVVTAATQSLQVPRPLSPSFMGGAESTVGSASCLSLPEPASDASCILGRRFSGRDGCLEASGSRPIGGLSGSFCGRLTGGLPWA